MFKKNKVEVIDLVSDSDEPDPISLEVRRESIDTHIPIEEIHKNIPNCESKYPYYGTHDNILEGDDTEAEDVPLFYDETGTFQLILVPRAYYYFIGSRNFGGVVSRIS